jgi:uncharacterized protein
MIRLVLDTNVIVSGLVFGGVPRRVLELAEAGQCQLFYSEPIRNEVYRVLADKFDWAPAMLQQVLPTVWDIGELVSPETAIRAVLDDPDDDRILECASAADASFIDRHLLTLRTYKSISIVTPRQFLDIYIEEQK